MKQLFSFIMMIISLMPFAAHAGSVAKTVTAPQRTGTIIFTTEVRATVWVDHRNIGTTTKSAFVAQGIPVGHRSLKISKANYYDYVDPNVIVRAGQTINLGVLPLRLIPGSIRVSSDPPGASVELDGQNRSSTSNAPLVIPDVAAGAHTIKLKKEGYVEFHRTIIVRPNAETSLGTVHLARLPLGTITVITNLRGATVFLDDRYVGRTLDQGNTLTIADVSPGVHNVRVSRLGHLDYGSGDFQVEGGREYRFAVTLIPRPGFILLGSVPGSARIALNGLPKGNTPDTGQVRVSADMTPLHMNDSIAYSRSFELSVEKEGYDRYQQSVIVVSGQTLNLGTISLVPRQTTATATRGYLWVGSVPPGATVFLGEAGGVLAERGKSALFIEGLTPGTRYTVRLHRRGFRDSVRDYVQGTGGMSLFLRLEQEEPARR